LSNIRSLVPHLPCHDRARLVKRYIPLAKPHRFQSVADRSQRIAQLVGQRGQELVLAAIGLFERLFGTNSLGDINGHSSDEGRLSIGPWNRKLADDGMVQAAVSVLQGLDRLYARRAPQRQVVVMDKLSG